VRPGVYMIVVEGELGPRYTTAFGAMRIEARDGDTAIVGMVEDQAELQGLIDSVSALGLSLVSVSPVNNDPDAS
jgi:hypothetical protein